MSVTAEDDEAREDFLRAYVTTYPTEEIKADSLVRDIGNFSRFPRFPGLLAHLSSDDLPGMQWLHKNLQRQHRDIIYDEFLRTAVDHIASCSTSGAKGVDSVPVIFAIPLYGSGGTNNEQCEPCDRARPDDWRWIVDDSGRQ